MPTERQQKFEADADRLIASLKMLRPTPAKRAPARPAATGKSAAWKPARAHALTK
jgi:hypothetical protein